MSGDSLLIEFYCVDNFLFIFLAKLFKNFLIIYVLNVYYLYTEKI